LPTPFSAAHQILVTSSRTK